VSHQGIDEPAVPQTGGGGLVRVRLDLGYDGTDFHGWARQPHLRTVQGVIEDALRTVLRLAVTPETTCAGRTDSGVHARGQVAHVDVPAALVLGEHAPHGPDDLLRRLAGALPHDVRVFDVCVAPPGFDARFGALTRRYAYRICDDVAGPDPLARRFTLWHASRLDVDAMDAASAALEGEHDFAAFCKRRAGASTVRRLVTYRWQRVGPGSLEATVVADAFCHSMVRALVGGALAVGVGRRPAPWLREVLAGAVRVPEINVAGPTGLTLEAVTYPEPVRLAAQAEATRRFRGSRPVSGQMGDF
jgi:tRNA pseudouridine38-40 synthase